MAGVGPADFREFFSGAPGIRNPRKKTLGSAEKGLGGGGVRVGLGFSTGFGALQKRL